MRACIAALVLAMLGPAATVAGAATAPWSEITSPGATSATINPIPDIAWDGTGLWAAWGTDTFDVEVRRWNGTAWSSYPQPVNETTRNKMPSITWDGTRPWVAWNDDSYAVRVAYWNGTSWVQVTSPGTATSTNSTPDLLFANGSVHAAWQDSGRVVRVARWNGSSWVAIASPGSGGTANAYPNLGWDGSNLYVAWSQPSTAQVARLDGAAWTSHSSLSTGTGSNTLPSLLFIAGRLYLAYETNTSSVGLSWWDGAQYRAVPSPGGGPTVFTYPSLEWTGTRLWASYVIDPDDVTVAWYDPVAPVAPSSLAQLQSDAATGIASGAWTPFGGTTNLILRGSMTDAQSSEQLLPWIEMQPNGTAFATTCGRQVAGATWVGAAVGAPAGGTSYTGSTTVTGLTNGSSYAWRMCVVDRFGFPSGWTARGSSPDLRIDTSMPTAAPSTPANGATGISTSPSLVAAYTDPAPANTGTIEFELCTTSGCTTVLQSWTSASLASGSSATWVPGSDLAPTTSYWWRTRARDVAGNVGAWSAARSFTTNATTITLSVDAATVALGSVLPTQDAFGTSTFTVTTNSPGGYQLVARDESDTWAADAGALTVPDWTGTDAAPSAWAAGVAGGMGMTMLTETGPAAKLAKWGTGTTASDFALNRYAGLEATTDTIVHTRASFSAAAENVTVAWRANVSTTQAPATYGATTVWTAVALP